MVHSNIFYINIVLHYKPDPFLYFCLVYVCYMCENTPQDTCEGKRTTLADHSLFAALHSSGYQSQFGRLVQQGLCLLNIFLALTSQTLHLLLPSAACNCRILSVPGKQVCSRNGCKTKWEAARAPSSAPTAQQRLLPSALCLPNIGFRSTCQL